MKSEPISPLVLPTKPNKHPAITNTKCRKFKKDEGKRTARTVCVQIQEIPAFSYKCSSCIKHVTATTCLVSFSFAWQRVNARTHTHEYTHLRRRQRALSRKNKPQNKTEAEQQNHNDSRVTGTNLRLDLKHNAAVVIGKTLNSRLNYLWNQANLVSDDLWGKQHSSR